MENWQKHGSHWRWKHLGSAAIGVLVKCRMFLPPACPSAGRVAQPQRSFKQVFCWLWTWGSALTPACLESQLRGAEEWSQLWAALVQNGLGLSPHVPDTQSDLAGSLRVQPPPRTFSSCLWVNSDLILIVSVGRRGLDCQKSWRSEFGTALLPRWTHSQEISRISHNCAKYRGERRALTHLTCEGGWPNL